MKVLGCVAIIYVWFLVYISRERTRALRKVFTEIRKRKRTYVLNDEGTAYVLQEKEL